MTCYGEMRSVATRTIPGTLQETNQASFFFCTGSMFMILLCTFWSSWVTVDKECLEVGSHFFKVSWDFWGQYYLLLAMHPFPWYITMFTVWYPPKHVKSYFVPVSMEAFSRWSYWMHMATHEYLILDECWRWIQHTGVNANCFEFLIPLMSGMARALPCLARAGDGVHLNVLEQPNRQTGF